MSHEGAVQELSEVLNRIADADIAQAMAAYMINNFEFFGIKKPARESVTKSWIQERKNLPFVDLNKIVKILWSQPQREFQYVAIDLMKSSKIFKHEASIALLEYTIREKSWWDSVDLIASGLVGGYFLSFPKNRDKQILEWCNDSHLWIRRTSIIFQLTYRDKTDEELLMSTILTHIESKEFFLRKAMGWALRQYARTNPEFVVQFVNAHHFSGLTVREALKHLNK